MKIICFLATFILIHTGNLGAQAEWDHPQKEWLGRGEFVVRGEVRNKPAEMTGWNLAVTGYLSNQGYEIPVADDGRFEMAIPVTDVQDIYLYLQDAISVFSFPGDTLTLSFDGTHQKETLTLTGTTTQRTRELELCLEVFRSFRRDYLELSKLRYNRDRSPEEKLQALNEYYDRKITLIREFEEKNGSFPFLRKFRDETYYEAAWIAAAEEDMLSKLSCDYPRGSYTMVANKDTADHPILPHEVLDYNAFRTIPVYRTFISSHLAAARKAAFAWTAGYPEPTGGNAHIPAHALADRYHYAKNALNPVPPIRDWYLSDLINMALTYEAIADVDSLYHDLRNICGNETYLEVLEPKYRQALALAPGQPAPDFELKDLDGNTVRLSDFRGKIVYLDFWGVGCGPCVYEFQHAKEEFHRKYGTEEIVFVYVCVDSNETQWRKAVEKYELKGVNLIAEGWKDHPACQSYNVEGVPHYTLIDKEGTIVNNDCARPSVLLLQGAHNELEQLLLRYR